MNSILRRLPGYGKHSMGYEAENEARKKAFADWCVDAEMMAAAKPDALFMHCHG